jgi:hypothetical protein
MARERYWRTLWRPRLQAFLATKADKLTADGRARLVRHGRLPEREIVTGIGPVAVRCPRVRDRAADGEERIPSHRRFCRPTRAGQRASKC